jgi:hypothetical protein
MGWLTDFLNHPPPALLIWLPLLFFGTIVYLLWRTLQLMPRIRPTSLQPHSKSSIGWADVAGLEEV